MRPILVSAILIAPLVAQDPTLDLYVASRDTHSIKRFDGATGTYLGDFVKPRAGGLSSPQDVAFGRDGDLYVRGQGGTPVYRFDRDTGAFLGTSTPSGKVGEKWVFSKDPSQLDGVIEGPEGALYVCDWEDNVIRRFDADTGAPLGVFAVGGGMRHPVGLAFGSRPGTTDKAAANHPDGVRERTGLRFSVLESKIRRRLIRTKTPYGFKIRSVDKDSPAAAAGLEKGHIVMKWDGEPLRTMRQLRDALGSTAKETEVKVESSAHVAKASLFNRRPWRTRETTIVLK